MFHQVIYWCRHFKHLHYFQTPHYCSLTHCTVKPQDAHTDASRHAPIFFYINLHSVLARRTEQVDTTCHFPIFQCATKRALSLPCLAHNYTTFTSLSCQVIVLLCALATIIIKKRKKIKLNDEWEKHVDLYIPAITAIWISEGHLMCSGTVL